MKVTVSPVEGRSDREAFVKLPWRLKVRGLKTGRSVLLGIKKEYRTRIALLKLGLEHYKTFRTYKKALDL